MGKFVKGDMVVIPFPFSDLSSSKRRPALVLADLKGSDVILCLITSQHVRDEYAIPLYISDFQDGNLNQDSHIRPNRLFTADVAIVAYKAVWAIHPQFRTQGKNSFQDRWKRVLNTSSVPESPAGFPAPA